MSHVLSVLLGDDDLDGLIEVAEGIEGIEVGDPDPVDASGDGLSFPIDPALAVETLQVVVVAVSTLKAIADLLSAFQQWRDSRSGAKQELPVEPVVIGDVAAGKTLHSNHSLTDLDIERIVAALGSHE